MGWTRSQSCSTSGPDQQLRFMPLQRLLKREERIVRRERANTPAFQSFRDKIASLHPAFGPERPAYAHGSGPASAAHARILPLDGEAVQKAICGTVVALAEIARHR